MLYVLLQFYFSDPVKSQAAKSDNTVLYTPLGKLCET